MRDLAQVKYGEEAWDNVRKMANIDTPTFSIHQVMAQGARVVVTLLWWPGVSGAAPRQDCQEDLHNPRM